MNDALPKPPRRFMALTIFCLFCAVLFSALGVLLFLGFTGNAKTSDLVQDREHTECVREVLAEYEEARDAFIYANTGETREDARANLEALYFPDGPAGEKIDRAERTLRVCG